MIQQDFKVFDITSCDPSIDSCFIYECEEGEEDCDDTPYAKIEKSARDMETCVPSLDNECPELSCGPGDQSCVITTCSESELEEGELCTAPEDYQEATEDADPPVEIETE